MILHDCVRFYMYSIRQPMHSAGEADVASQHGDVICRGKAIARLPLWMARFGHPAQHCFESQRITEPRIII